MSFSNLFQLSLTAFGNKLPEQPAKATTIGVSRISGSTELIARRGIAPFRSIFDEAQWLDCISVPHIMQLLMGFPTQVYDRANSSNGAMS